MPVYSFYAKESGGKTVKGEIDAVSVVEARVKLRAQRLTPTKVEPKGSGKKGFSIGGGGVSQKDLQIFTRQFSTLITSGIAIVQALQMLESTIPSLPLREAVAQIRKEVETGKRFAEALKAHPKIFDSLYVNLVRAGEESGTLDSLLNRLSVYIEKSARITGKVKSAMFYPVAVLVISMLVVVGILVFVIPKFEDMFKSSGQELPGLTQMVVNASHFLFDYWYMVIGVAVGSVWGLLAFYKSPQGKKFFAVLFLRLPLIGTLIRKNGVARFTRTLATMLQSGIGIIESLDIAGSTIGNWVMESTVEKAKKVVLEGKSMTVAFAKDPNYPEMVVQMIAVGEQTGAMDSMLGKVADFYEEEVEQTVGAITSLIEPAMMVILGGIIAVLVVAMYLPIFNMAGGVK